MGVAVAAVGKTKAGIHKSGKNLKMSPRVPSARPEADGAPKGNTRDDRLKGGGGESFSFL